MDEEDGLSQEERELRDKARAFMQGLRDVMSELGQEEGAEGDAEEITLELDPEHVQFMAGYDDDNKQAFVRVLFRMDAAFIQLTPEQAIYLGQAMIECGYSSMTTEIVFDLARHYLADAMGNVRPFQEEDAGKLRIMLRAYHEQRERRAGAGMTYEKRNVNIPKE